MSIAAIQGLASANIWEGSRIHHVEDNTLFSHTWPPALHGKRHIEMRTTCRRRATTLEVEMLYILYGIALEGR